MLFTSCLEQRNIQMKYSNENGFWETPYDYMLGKMSNVLCPVHRTKIFPSHRTGCSESVVNDSIIDALRTQKLLVLTLSAYSKFFF